jgi:hypothetical protein
MLEFNLSQNMMAGTKLSHPNGRIQFCPMEETFVQSDRDNFFAYNTYCEYTVRADTMTVPHDDFLNVPSIRVSAAQKSLSSPGVPLSIETLSPPISPLESKAVNTNEGWTTAKRAGWRCEPHTNTTKDAKAGLPLAYTRGISAGEFSLMLGLSDPTLEESEMKLPQRPCGVSFGKKVVELSPGSTHEVQLKDPKQRHTLTDDTQRSTRLISSPQKAANLTASVEEKLAKAYIVNPIESEGEKAIIRALEERERNTNHSTAAGVLPSLPDDVVVSFQEHSNEVQQQQASS